MQFYTYAYLMRHVEVNALLQYGIIFVLLIALLTIGVKFMYNRFNTKYRDLSIILCLLIVFSIGIQFNDYTRSVSDAEDSSKMVAFVNLVSEQMGVSKDTINVNSIRLRDGMIIKIADVYYEVNFTQNVEAYDLRRVQMLSTDVKVIDVGQ